MNGFDALESSLTRTTSNGGIQKSLNEVDSPGSQSLTDSDFEMPPEFPAGATVGDLASHISRVVSNTSLIRNDLDTVDESGSTLGSKEYEKSEKLDLSFPCVAPASAGRSFDALVHKVDRLQDARKKAPSSSNYLNSPKPSKSKPYILDTPSITSDCDKSPHESSKFVDNLQNTNFPSSKNAADNDSTDFTAQDHIPKDPEYYSNSSSENDEFDDFAAFQSAEPEQVSVVELGPSQNVSKEVADFSDFREPNYPNKSILPAYSLVVRFLITRECVLCNIH